METRTQQQNRALFKFHEMVVSEMNNQGITLDNLVLEVHPRPTKTSLHEVFKAILLSMYGKDSSRLMTRQEMNECLDVYMQALAMSWVVIEFPSADRQNLLNYFS